MRETKWYKGKYFQGSMSDDEAEKILDLLQNYTSVENLRHVIRLVPDHIILDMLHEHETPGETIKDHSSELGVGTLTDQQTIGVAFMYFAKSALLGDEVGLGKTVEVAGLCNLLEAEYRARGKKFRCLFLCEKTSVGQIKKKLIKFTGNYYYGLPSGEQDVVAKYINNYDVTGQYSVVGSHSLLLSSEFLIHTSKHPFDVIVIDESSILRNTSADYFVNTRALFRFHDRKILLNATPLETVVRDFYNQLDILDKGYMPSVSEFERQFCKKTRQAYGFAVTGYKNQEVFREAVSLRYLARTRHALGAKYEHNSGEVILVPLSKVQKELNRKTTLYQMVSDYPSGVDRTVPFNTETTPKAKALVELLDKIDVASGKALIYCRFLDCQDKIKELLEEHGYSCVILNGKTPSKKRAAIIDEFTSGLYDVMITNVQKSLDLNNCDNCIMYTIDPNPQKMVQFEGRITREFDIAYKSVWLLVSMGREKKFVEETLRVRINASSAFAQTGRSMVTEAIQGTSEAGGDKQC